MQTNQPAPAREQVGRTFTTTSYGVQHRTSGGGWFGLNNYRTEEDARAVLRNGLRMDAEGGVRRERRITRCICQHEVIEVSTLA